MTKEQQQFYQMCCLRDERAEELTKRILNDPRDVSYEYYSKVFADFDWSEYEKIKATSQE